jgi:hypothetical protein
MRRCRRTLLWCVVATMLAGALAPTQVGAKPVVRLSASFIPYRLGHSTTVRFGFDITTTSGATPPPLLSVGLHLPKGINQNASQLGLNICQPTTLAELGPHGCPVNSQIGFGTANVEVQFGHTRVPEQAVITTFAGPAKSSSELLFFNEGRTPINSRVVYPGHVREESGPFSGDLETTVPLIPTVPGGNDLATTSFESTLGPLGLTYYRTIDGQTKSFQPEGIYIPKTCPPKGFPFMVEVRFRTGAVATNHHNVPCPAGGYR